MDYIDKVVDVQVLLGTQPIDTESFEVPLFLAIHNLFPQRVRSYSNLDGILADGFAVGSPVHSFASKVFSGIFAPATVKVGRQNETSSVLDFSTTTNETDIVVNITVKDGTTVTAKAITYTPTTLSTPQAIATAIASAINLDEKLKLLILAEADEAIVSFTAVKEGAVWSLGYGSFNFDIVKTTDETVAVAMPIVEDYDANFYFVSAESHKPSDIEGLSDYALANYKLHAYSTQDELVKDPSDETNIFWVLKQKQAKNSIGMYHETADKTFPEGGVIGAMAANDPSFGDSIHLKTMSGVVASRLGASNQASAREAIVENNGNFYILYKGAGCFWNGLVGDGNFVDTIRFSHWLKFRIEESVYGYMKRRSDLGLSMKMSDDDLPVLESVILNNPINVGIRNSGILTGFDAENNVDYTPIITIPKRAQIPTNDLAKRFLDNVGVQVVYNGALHFIKIRASVELDRQPTNNGAQ